MPYNAYAIDCFEIVVLVIPPFQLTPVSSSLALARLLLLSSLVLHPECIPRLCLLSDLLTPCDGPFPVSSSLPLSIIVVTPLSVPMSLLNAISLSLALFMYPLLLAPPGKPLDAYFGLVDVPPMRCCLPRKTRKSGRSVAIEHAAIPSPVSAQDQIATSTVA